MPRTLSMSEEKPSRPVGRTFGQQLGSTLFQERQSPGGYLLERALVDVVDQRAEALARKNQRKRDPDVTCPPDYADIVGRGFCLRIHRSAADTIRQLGRDKPSRSGPRSAFDRRRTPVRRSRPMSSARIVKRTENRVSPWVRVVAKDVLLASSPGAADLPLYRPSGLRGHRRAAAGRPRADRASVSTGRGARDLGITRRSARAERTARRTPRSASCSRKRARARSESSISARTTRTPAG